MIEIALEEKEQPALKEFDEREWPGADQEHYGDQDVDFVKHHFALVAREGSDVVGYISLVLDAGVLRMESLIVAEKFRGQGVGARLVTEAEAKGRSLGAHIMTLETGSDWKARLLYEKLGYTVRANLRNYYANRDFVLMDKAL